MPPQQFDLFARSERKVYSVYELTRQLKALLEGRFPAVWVEGEISNLRRPGSGHLYFTLKDDRATLGAVMFASEARRLRFEVKDGLKVLAHGRLSVYEDRGSYQLYVGELQPKGAGALMIAFEELKRKLAAEGLFDEARKRRIPFLPRRIGVVTSPSGAAVRDFLRVLHRRFPNLPVLIAPCRVQGEDAAPEIALAVRRVAAVPDVDVVVVTRGGGSIEDLWAFNEEVVARAIAACPVPVVSAVGHEVDFTIADFVADRRVPTPTAAAELLAPVKDELRADLLSREGRVKRAFGRELERRRALAQALGARVADPRRLIGERRMRLDALEDRALKPLRAELKRRREALDAVTQRLLRAHPRAHIGEVRRRVALLLDRLSLGARRAVTQRKAREAGLAGRLEAMSPLAVLARGYSVTFRERDGHALRRHDEVAPGEKVRVRLAEGELSAEVTAARPPVDPSSSGG